mmetsp:Transcript_9755/g.21815  ORF Transcript_9755/g.21815 Transcript_9755/m.21815 type:complete len:143 (-) Transcript_9755:185-613(-)
MKGFTAAVTGAAMLHLLSWLLAAPLARAGWCWSADGNAGSVYGCTSAATIGQGACHYHDSCCGGYTCHAGGQCVTGASADDPDGPLAGNTRIPVLATSDSCTTTNTTTEEAQAGRAFRAYGVGVLPLLTAVTAAAACPFMLR